MVASLFGWVDFAEDDRRKMLDVVNLFNERETRDELGIGSIRDAFADLFFPGTSVIQTRVKYMLLVPWIYLDMERKRVASTRIEARARREEIKLIKVLLDNGETDGVIGRDAGQGLVRLPSSIYWSGLQSWGLRLFQGSQDQYHRSLDAFYRRAKDEYGGEADEEIGAFGAGPNWHPGLPLPDGGFPATATLTLNATEAEFLKERVLLSHGNSLLAHLVKDGRQVKTEYPWQHPALTSAGEHIQSLMVHARNFAEVIHGAALLYNLMLATKAKREKLIQKFEWKIHTWVDNVLVREVELKHWHSQVASFWSSQAFSGDRAIHYRTRDFVGQWLHFALETPGAAKVLEDQAAQRLIEKREWELKRERARLSNQNALLRWRGASGTEMLTYRWKTASSFVDDIVQGLKGS